MSRDNSFKDYIVEDVLGHVEGITSRAMFSGHCIFLDRVAVGLISGGTLYLKTDKETKVKYEQEGEKPFQYDREAKGRSKAKTIVMSYMSVGLETLEDREKIKERIYESLEISKRVKK